MAATKGTARSWIKRATAAAVVVAAAISGFAAVSINLASIAESFGKFKWWGPQTPGNVTLRNLHLYFVAPPGSTPEKTDNIMLKVEAVVVKSGQSPLENCKGQIILGPENFGATFEESGAAWQLAEGEYQELHSYHFDLKPRTYWGSRLRLRVICDGVITDFYPVANVKIKEDGAISIDINGAP
jgi:hypothetical protein